MIKLENLGRYKIISELGRGGMGIVMKGRDPRIDRLVALKIIKFDEIPEPGRKKELMERFYIEAKAAGKLTHPNIVTIYDVGEENGMSFIAMEYVEGRDLAAILDEVGEMPFKRAANLIMQIADGLSFAHDQGIVHRDIKPANILIQKNDRVKITDFGLARLQSAGSITQTGHAVGSPLYMSPEQVQGLPVDGRSDIFSLGVMFYEMVTNIRPFDGDSLSNIIFKIIQNNPAPPTSINSALGRNVDAVIGKMMAKDPEDRYKSCDEVLQDLQNISSLPDGFNELSGSDAAMTVKFSTNDDSRLKVKKSSKTGSPLAMTVALIITIGAGALWYLDGFDWDKLQGKLMGIVKAPVKGPLIRSKAEVSRPVGKFHITILSPIEGEVFIDGKSAGFTPLEKIEAEAGKRIVEVRAPFYKPWKRTVKAKDGSSLKFTARHELKGGAIKVESKPQGSAVFLDGRKIGLTPIIYGGIDPGEHKISIKLKGFGQVDHAINLTKDKGVALSADLNLLIGRLKVSSTKGALVYIDGKEAGKVPFEESLPEGKYKIEIRKKGFLSFTKKVSIGDDKTRTISFNLVKRGFGSIQVSAIPWANIFINNKEKGATPRLIEKILEGRVFIKLVNPGYKPYSKTVRLKKGERLEITHTFTEKEASKRQAKESKISETKTGSLKITSKPSGLVFIDGKPRGETPVVVTDLAVGTHEIVIKREGLADYNRKIDIVNDFVTRLAVE